MQILNKEQGQLKLLQLTILMTMMSEKEINWKLLIFWKKTEELMIMELNLT